MATTSSSESSKVLSADDKRMVRELVGEWLEVEKTWTKNICLRRCLLALVMPAYAVHQVVYNLFVLVVTLVALLLTVFMCVIVCFRLDGVARTCCKLCIKGPQEPTGGDQVSTDLKTPRQGEEGELHDNTNAACLTKSVKSVLQYQLWAQLVLFSPGRFLIKEKLSKIRVKSEKLISQKSDFTYVIPKETVLALERWPKFEEAIAAGILVKTSLDAMRPPQTGARIFAPVLFVSHKWIGNACDTDQNEILAAVKVRLNTTPKTYVWFDYSCVPQEDAHERMLHLRSIPDIISRCDVGVFLHKDLQLAENYMQSIWCQLEFILSGYDMTKLQAKRNWTIYDPSDLYLILPAFIHMSCRDQNYSEIFGSVRKTGGYPILAQILVFFSEWHDRNVGAGAV